MKLPIDPRLSFDPVTLVKRLYDLLKDSAQQVNGLTEGRIAARHNARDTEPVIDGAPGDFVPNSAPTIADLNLGWLRTVDGTWEPFGGSGGGGGGSVTSIAATAPAAGFTISGSPITSSGTLVFTLADDLSAIEGLSGTGFAKRTGTSAWSVVTPASTDISDFSEAVDDRVSSLLVAGSGITLSYNDGANTLTLSASGGGTVTSFTFTNANGVSGVVTNATTTPALTISLGAITPSSVVSSGTVTGSNITGTNTGDQTITLTGDVTGSGTGSFAATIGNDKVTYAKMQNVSATQKVVGRNTAGSGDPEEVSLTELLDWIGSPAQGDILYRGSSSWSRLGAGTKRKTLQTNGSGANPSWDWMTARAVTTATYTLADADVGQWLDFDTAGTAVATLSTASGYAIGESTVFRQNGAGQLQLAAGSGTKIVTSSTSKTRAQHSVIAATRLNDEGSGTAVFSVFGDMT